MSFLIQAGKAFFEVVKTLCTVLVVTAFVVFGYWLYVPLQLSLPDSLKNLKN